MRAWAHPLPLLSLSFLLKARGRASPASSSTWQSLQENQGACSANREALHGAELLEAGSLVIAQGSETTIPIWKIESILRLEFLVYDPLLLVPEMSSAESAINHPLLG